MSPLRFDQSSVHLPPILPLHLKPLHPKSILLPPIDMLGTIRTTYHLSSSEERHGVSPGPMLSSPGGFSAIDLSSVSSDQNDDESETECSFDYAPGSDSDDEVDELADDDDLVTSTPSLPRLQQRKHQSLAFPVRKMIPDPPSSLRSPQNGNLPPRLQRLMSDRSVDDGPAAREKGAAPTVQLSSNHKEKVAPLPARAPAPTVQAVASSAQLTTPKSEARSLSPPIVLRRPRGRPPKKALTVVCSSSESGDSDDEAHANPSFDKQAAPPPCRVSGKGGRLRWECSVRNCSQSFNRKADASRHFHAIHTPLIHMCDICGKHYSRPDSLVRHQQTAACKRDSKALPQENDSMSSSMQRMIVTAEESSK